MHKTVHYLVTSNSGRPLASFDTPCRARGFRDTRSSRNVPTRLFKVETIKMEISQ